MKMTTLEEHLKQNKAKYRPTIDLTKWTINQMESHLQPERERKISSLTEWYFRPKEFERGRFYEVNGVKQFIDAVKFIKGLHEPISDSPEAIQYAADQVTKDKKSYSKLIDSYERCTRFYEKMNIFFVPCLIALSTNQFSNDHVVAGIAGGVSAFVNILGIGVSRYRRAKAYNTLETINKPDNNNQVEQIKNV